MSGSAPVWDGGVSLADGVRAGLLAEPKRLSPSYFYDDVGSALFEAITHLPEYGLTRAEERLLAIHAAAISSAAAAGMVVELGSGSGRKTRPVLEAAGKRTWPLYCPVDLSAAALSAASLTLRNCAAVVTFEREYLAGLREATALRQSGHRLLVLFLGSNIGNFSPAERGGFLRAVREYLQPGDALLAGADLVKETQRMIAAYDDPAGVTAAFNRNVLARINRELRGRFDLRRFVHEVRYDGRERRVEMHLRSVGAQRVPIEECGIQVRFEAGETIWTESSHKFAPEEIEALGRGAGFVPRRRWIDREWPFALTLLGVA